MPMVHLLPHWTHPGMEGVSIPMCAYTNGDEAELWLSGRSLGKRLVEQRCAWWYVPYERGELRVAAYRDGRMVAESSVRTASAPARLELTADREALPADRMALVHVTVRILDAEGVFCPSAAVDLAFHVDGPGEAVAVGNGDPMAESVNRSRQTFMGMALCVVRSTGVAGTIVVRAHADDMADDRVSVEAR